MILAAFTWLLLGVILGIGIGGIFVSVYGDSELNEKIHNIRKARLDLALAKFEYKLKKFLYKNEHVNLVVTPKDKK